MVRTSIERQPDGTYNVYVEDRVLANLPTWDDAEEFHRDYGERHFGPLRGVRYVDADREEVLQAEAEASDGRADEAAEIMSRANLVLQLAQRNILDTEKALERLDLPGWARMRRQREVLQEPDKGGAE